MDFWKTGVNFSQTYNYKAGRLVRCALLLLVCDLPAAQSGICWLELLRLPYFDIIQCVVVDAMHNLFLGLIKEHFIGILGIGLPRIQESKTFSIKFSVVPTDFTEKEKKSVETLKKWLEAPVAMVFSTERELAINKLKRLHVQAIHFACDELGCLPAPDANGKYSKDLLVGVLLDWVCTLSLCFIL